MKTLIHYEKKKLLRRKSTIIALLLMVLGICAINMIFISDQFWYREDGTEVSGIDAIRTERRMERANAGLLTQEVLIENLRRFHQVNDDPANYDSENRYLRHDVYCRELIPHYGIMTLLVRAYSAPDYFDVGMLSSVTEEMAANFYEARHTKVQTILNAGDFTQAEKEAVLKLDQKVSEPFTYDYTDGWRTLMVRGFWMSFLLIALAVCIIVSPIFACEYQTGADAIVLSTKRGRGDTVRAKIAAGLIVTSGVYVLGVCLSFICALVPFGASGWNCELQILSDRSFYALKIWQTVLCGVVTNYLVILSVMAFVMLLSSQCKTPFSAVIIGMIFTLVPMFIPNGSTSSLFNHILALLPARAMETYAVFTSYIFFSVGKVVILLPCMILICAVVLTAVMLPIAHRRFCRHQVL